MRQGYLYAGFPEINTESIRVPGIVFHQLLQSPESCPPRYEETTFVQLPENMEIIQNIAPPAPAESGKLSASL
jgi:hypothetical protein